MTRHPGSGIFFFEVSDRLTDMVQDIVMCVEIRYVYADLQETGFV